ncbi:hypothetical protein ONZ45_g11671 [Pleurotus djamor]|nr:hypothetical protein ONZ45_g11671 [Pleurotus djamor]
MHGQGKRPQNRYLAPVFIITHSLGDFLASFDSNPKLSWLYVLQGSKSVLFSASAVILCQWAIILYAVAQPSKATSQIAVLLPPELSLELPPLPTIDPFHVCLIMSTLPNGASLVEAFLYLSLTFDSVAFICILGVTISAARNHYFTELFRVIQRDGVAYFFVLFSSNLTWLLLALYGRPGLKALHNQPAMIISSIMINRITLNLREATARDNVHWGISTFRRKESSADDVPTRLEEIPLQFSSRAFDQEGVF